MSIQITAGSKGLLALGLGIGDVASIIALSRRYGNWWSATSGDKELIDLLGQDEYQIISRQGLIDPLAFNKRWRQSIRLLGNGDPISLSEEGIAKVMKNSKDLLAVSS